jgi:CDGSH-type Zn-finger protein
MDEPKVTIWVKPKGSLHIIGGCKLIDKEGKETVYKETIHLCRCGESSRKPFCDGAHRKIDFEG